MESDEQEFPESFSRQLMLLSDCVAACRAARDRVVDLQKQIAAREQERQEHLEVIDRWHTDRLQKEQTRLRDAAQAERQAIEQDCRSRVESFRREKQETLQEITSELKEEIARIREQEKNELWVLQSVLDEEAVDSPVGELEREKDTCRLQNQAIQDLLKRLEDRIRRAQQWLDECHAGTERRDPPPRPWTGEQADLTATIQQTGDDLFAQAARMESFLPAQWIRGPRLWLLSAVCSVLTMVPVAIWKGDRLRSLLGSDPGPDGWTWLIVVVVSGLAAGAFFAVLSTLVVQTRLRSDFQSMLQKYSSLLSLKQVRDQRTAQLLNKLERTAETWRRQAASRRKKKTRQIEQQFGKQRAAVEERLQQMRRHCEDECAAFEKQQNEQAARDLQQIDERLQQNLRALSLNVQQARQEQQAECRRQFDETIQASLVEIREQAECWSRQADRVHMMARAARAAVGSSRGWPDPPAQRWTASKVMPRAITPGDFLVALPRLPDSPDDRTPDAFLSSGTADHSPSGQLCVDMPAVLVFPEDTSIVVEHDAAGRETALGFLRAQILRLLLTIPPGRIRLTLIDPVGLGQSFSAMMHLADFDELLIQSRIWTDELQIRSQLRNITEHMEDVFQTYLRSEFRTIEEYNAAAGEVAEPYHFVVIADFPAGLSEDAARHLSSILTSGPRCGVHTLTAWNPATGSPPGFDVEQLREHGTVFRVSDGRVLPASEQLSGIRFEAEAEPEPAAAVRLVRAVGEQSKDARRVEVSFRRIAPAPNAIWSHSTADGIDLPIGRAGAARLQFLRLGRGTSQHVLVAGKTGSGKSTFLHIVVTNLALHYSPDEIEFWLIDFKKGVEFRTYAAERLPHARVVAIESDREFGLSVLERLDGVLQERGELFRSRGVQDVPSFRTAFPDEPMPRLLLLIDEFQEFFTAEDRVSSRASLLLDRLIRQGRAFGIHVMLGSQTLGGAYSLARSTLGQVAVRVALQCSESDAHLILSEDNAAARLLTRPGEAIYNDANGLREGNHPFQIAWLDDEEREQWIRLLRERSAPSGERPMIVFEGSVPPAVEHCGPLQAALQGSPDATRRSFDPPSVWLGEPVAIAGPVHVRLRRAGGQNLLLVGQDETAIDSMLAMILISVCGAAGSEAGVTLLHSIRQPDVLARFDDLVDSGAVPGCRLAAADATAGVIDDFLAELERREQMADHAVRPERLLIIRDIGQFRELRRDDDEFGLGSFGDAAKATTATKLGDLIRRGPLVGLHVVIWADTYSNVTRWLSATLLREFENRVALRMNQTDSASLVDSPAAAGLGSGRALLYRDETGSVEKFRPFAWPGADWIREIAARRSGNSGPDPDIESIRIE